MAFIKKVDSNSLPTIIIPNSNPLNIHSKIDGIGALTVSLPKNIYFAMFNDPDWQWYFDGENESIAIFAKMNPQFQPQYRVKFGSHPPLPINKDGKTLRNVIGYPESFTREMNARVTDLRRRADNGEVF